MTRNDDCYYAEKSITKVLSKLELRHIYTHLRQRLSSTLSSAYGHSSSPVQSHYVASYIAYPFFSAWLPHNYSCSVSSLKFNVWVLHTILAYVRVPLRQREKGIIKNSVTIIRICCRSSETEAKALSGALSSYYLCSLEVRSLHNLVLGYCEIRQNQTLVKYRHFIKMA